MSATPSKTRYRILIVDDHREFIERLMNKIRKTAPGLEFEFDYAMTGDSAIEKVKASLPDIILLDNMLADEDSSFTFINARDLYGELRARGFHGIPVIVITYDPDVYNVRDLMKMGVKGVFSKDDLFCAADGCTKLLELIQSSASF